MKALFVIDMLNEFIREEGALDCGDTARKIIPFVKDKIDEFHDLYQEYINPEIKNSKGYRGFYLLMDPETGKGIFLCKCGSGQQKAWGMDPGAGILSKSPKIRP